MVAQPNPGGSVYKRDNWNDVIGNVNDKRENPPEDTDCEPLDLISEVDPEHIWTVSDVQSVRDAIEEMCPADHFDTAIPDYWQQEIIDEINRVLATVWDCCEEDECLEQCSNASEDVDTYIGAFTTSGCHTDFTPYCTPAQGQLAEDAGIEAAVAKSDWSDLQIEYCSLVDACEKLQEELEELEEELTALESIRDDECAKPPPNSCKAAQADVDAKQDEIDAKETELEEKEAEQDEKKSEADEKATEMDAKAAESMTLMDAVGPPSCQYFYSSAPGNQPCVDSECDALGPAWAGKMPLRCCVSWSVRRKSHIYWPDSGVEWHSPDWNLMASGSYTVSGQPYVTYIAACGGIPSYACVSTTCEHPCSAYHVYEVKLNQNFPAPHNPICPDNGDE